MNKYFWSFLIITSILVSLFGISLMTWKSQEESSKDTIVKFFKIVERGDKEALVPFMTNEPDYVAQKSLEEFKKIYKIEEKEENNSKNSQSGDVRLAVKSPNNYSGIELVNSMPPITLFFYRNCYLREIVNLKETGKEARARVKVSNKEDQKGGKLADLELDFFLFKEKDGWKIFLINFPKQNEKFDNYKFFAEPKKSVEIFNTNQNLMVASLKSENY
jgi:hypothetical protein